jgi:hypothetical protein
MKYIVIPASFLLKRMLTKLQLFSVPLSKITFDLNLFILISTSRNIHMKTNDGKTTKA